MNKVVKKLEIKNKLGLHARASALLVQTVNKFSAQVTLFCDGKSADGRSILGVMTLGSPQGSTVEVEAQGEDADRVVRAIEKLVDARFNEDQ
jgi:phosphotransferase system HPr (HPr) family protein